MIKAIRECLHENLILFVAIIIGLFLVFSIAWKSFTVKAIKDVTPVNQYTSMENQEEITDSDSTEPYFEHTAAGTIYHVSDSISVGPYPYIYEDDIYCSWDTIARYIGNNGKIGYINRDGGIITDPIFISAEEFQDGTARVQEELGSIYYIDKEGNRITQNYVDGSDTFEMQGEFCRVKTEDGKWGIVDREDQLVFSGADSIEELPYVTTIGSAVVDGKAVLFYLEPFEAEKFQIIATYDEFSKISSVYYGEFAYVWNSQDQIGVIDYTGQVLIPVKYQSIEHMYLGEDYSLENMMFIAKDKNGINHIFRAEDILQERMGETESGKQA